MPVREPQRLGHRLERLAVLGAGRLAQQLGGQLDALVQAGGQLGWLVLQPRDIEAEVKFANSGSENKVSFVAAVQTTAAGHPLLASLQKLEFTKEAIGEWARKSMCASAEVVSDGLWCFQAVTAVGASHKRTVTGGGAASVKLQQLKAVDTLLGNLKTAFAGTYHSFNFDKYAHRLGAQRN